MTKPNYTHIEVLLDRSGSMKRVENDTIGGFNTFVEEQKRVPGEATITLRQFSDTCETTYADVPLAHVAALTNQTYRPSGWTALNDALAATIEEVGAKLSAKPEAERPSRVVVLIMTDGEENRSKKFIGPEGLTKLSHMVSHQKDKYAWEFVFIGANINSFATANTYGIDRGHAINYSQEAFGTSNAFKSLSRGMATSRMKSSVGAAPSLNFFENERSKEFIAYDQADTLDIGATIDKIAEELKNTTTPQDQGEKTNG